MTEWAMRFDPERVGLRVMKLDNGDFAGYIEAGDFELRFKDRNALRVLDIECQAALAEWDGVSEIEPHSMHCDPPIHLLSDDGECWTDVP